MRFVETELEGVRIVEPAPARDERGSFARTFCELEFAAAGLVHRFVQHSQSRSLKKGTLRGMHFQEAPEAETKLVACIAGAVYDVVVDLRPGSPSRYRWIAVELTQENGRQLYIPEGFAHGFMTLCEDAVVSYLISAWYAPGLARGIRYDDPLVGIEWPAMPSIISERDLGWPMLAPGAPRAAPIATTEPAARARRGSGPRRRSA